MPAITRTALVAYSPAELFALVSDVASYADYLPHCVESVVLERSADEVTARIAFARAGIRQALTTRNRHVAPHAVEMELVDGPFAHLRGRWQFQPLGDRASKVVFSVEYEMDSRLVHLVAGVLVDEAAGIAVDAFQRRAAQLYGRRV